MNHNKNNENLHDFYNRTAQIKRRSSFYRRMLERYYTLIIPQGKRVLELGCGNGGLLAACRPSYGVGIDFAENAVDIARQKYPHLNFITADAHQCELADTFDYIILSDLVCSVYDAQKVFANLRRMCTPRTRIVISLFNYGWQPFLKMLEAIGLKHKVPAPSWFSVDDIKGLLYLTDFETVSVSEKLLLPMYIPCINFIVNRLFANFPLISRINLLRIVIARPLPAHSEAEKEKSVSIVIPARNERGNIESAIKRTPHFGSHQEFVFIEGHSNDDTYEEILRVREAYPQTDIKVMRQSGRGKGNAVREAFDAANGDVLMILDADLTMPPEELPKFYDALINGKGEFINGCRLVYPMEKEAMRLLNLAGNKFFGWFFSFLLGQRLKDTLCGTKALYRSDYADIKANRRYFGDFDPFGDFDLLFGAAKQNLKIAEVIIRYHEREYGSTQISRFRHGLLLLQMSLFAAKKIKFT